MAKHEHDLDPVDIGHEQQAGDGGVTIRVRDGHATILPRALESLSPGQYDAVEELQDCVAKIRLLQDMLGEAVVDARAEGLSWNTIGWCIGTTGSAAQQRFAPPPVRPRAERRGNRKR